MKVIDTYYRDNTRARWDRISRRTMNGEADSGKLLDEVLSAEREIIGNYAIVVSTIPDELISTLD